MSSPITPAADQGLAAPALAQQAQQHMAAAKAAAEAAERARQLAEQQRNG